MTARRAALALAVMCGIAFLGLSFAELRARALAQRTQATFYGAYDGWDAPEATVGDGRSPRFPMMLRGRQEGTGLHTLRVVFPAEEGQAIRLGAVQFDGPREQPLRLTVTLNGGTPVTLQTASGTGRDPHSVEHGATTRHELSLPGTAHCGHNEIVLQAEGGAWTALSRIDVDVPAGAGTGPWRNALGLVAVAAGLAFAVLALRRPSRAHTPFAHAALLLLGCALGLGLSEGALRAFGPRLGRVKPLLLASGEAADVEASAHVLDDLRGHRCAEAPCSLYDCGFRLNRDGFHTHDYAREKAPGVTRVIGLGDSFMAYTGPMPHARELFPLLEAEARRAAPARALEFIDLGFSCIGLVTERAILEGEALRLAPDAVVWTLYVGNDVTDETDGWRPPPRARGGPPPIDRWWGRSLLYRFVSRLAWLAASDPRLLFAGCAGPTASAPQAVCGVLENPRAAEPYDPARKTLTDAEYRAYALTRIDTLYRPERHAAVRGLMDLFTSRLAAIRARLGPVPAVFVLIPDELTVSPRELDRVLAMDPLLPRAGLDVEYMTARLAETLPQAGLDLVDLTPAFREETARGASLYQRNDGHLSADGSALAARLVGARLHARGVY